MSLEKVVFREAVIILRQAYMSSRCYDPSVSVDYPSFVVCRSVQQ